MSMNIKAALAQLSTTLANFDKAVGDLHSKHVDGRTARRTALNGELTTSVEVAAKANVLGHAILDGELLVLDVTSGNGTACPEVVKATVAALDARIKSQEEERKALAAARAAYDAQLNASFEAARKLRDDLCALVKPEKK